MVSKDEEIEKLKSEIERLKKELKKRKKYGLVWEDKKEDVVEMCKKKLPIIKEVKSREIITDKNKPVNLLIEGDNYHSLSVLNYTHAGKIDVIYIDPPYNTGNNDFIFNDNYVAREDAYRHSKWLSFMEKRLKLAKNLLKEDGVIFVSIDDNELAQLKLLMDSIFGENNFISIIVWKSKSGGAADSLFLAIDTEYIIAYAKNIKKLVFNKAPLESKKEYKYKDSNFTSYGKFKLRRLDETGIRYSKSLDFPIYINKDSIEINGEKIPISEKYFFNCDIPQNRITILPGGKLNHLKKYTWRWSKEKILKGFEKNYLVFIKNKNGEYRLMQKQYEFFDTSKEETISIRTTPYRNWIDFTNTTDGTIELTNIFHKKVFNYPKPVKLIKFIINLHPNKNAVVLDFFAGTGTTGHAVLELNKEDGGNRQFILCTNNENNICTDVCYPRIKKVIEGYKNSKEEWVEGLGGNLKYFKTDFVDYEEPTDKNKTKFAKHVTEMICVKEGTYEKVMDNEKFVIFKNSNHYTAIIWDQTAISEFKNAIKDMQGEFSVYIFSLTDDTFDEEFKDVKQKVTLSPIPEAILKVYRRIFR